MKIKTKKGNVHIDWVVSVAVFLTYLIVLLAFIKPNYKPSFEGDVLVNLARESFHNEVEWNVTKTLISFDCSNRGSGGITKVDDFSELVPEISDGRGHKVLRRDLSEMYQDYRDGFFIKIPYTDPPRSDSFWVFTAEGGYDKQGSLEGDAVQPSCEVSAANPIVFRGINTNKLNANDLKLNEWNFPQFRQFKIQILSSDGSLKDNRYCFAKGIIDSSECLLVEPPEDIVVYGVNLGDAILDKDGQLEQVILNIQVW